MANHTKFNWDAILYESYSWRKEPPRTRRSWMHLTVWLVLPVTFLLLLRHALASDYYWHDSLNLLLYTFKEPSKPLNLVSLSSFKSGARVIPELTSWKPPNAKRINWLVFTEKETLWPPAIALHANNPFLQCWCIDGHNARLGIRLTGPGYVHTVGVEHNLQALVEDNGTTPQGLRLWGGLEPTSHSSENQAAPYNSARPMTLLTSFTFNAKSAQPNQNFTLPIEAGRHLVSQIILEIISNWGGKNTCIYGIQVYGHKPEFRAV